MILNAEKKSIRDYKDAIIAMVKDGKTIKEISKTIGYSYAYMKQYCHDEGITSYRNRKSVSPQERSDIMELYKRGIPQSTIARLVGRSYLTVHALINRLSTKEQAVNSEETVHTVMQAVNSAVDTVNAKDQVITLPIKERPLLSKQPLEISESKPIQPVLSVERVESANGCQTPQVFEIPIVLRVSTVYNKPEVNNIA